MDTMACSIIIAFLLIFGITTYTGASTWNYCASTNESNFYYDARSIVFITQHTATVKVREISVQLDNLKSAKTKSKKDKSSGYEKDYIMTHNEIDCTTKEFRVLETIEVRTGKQISHIKTLESPFEKIPSGSIIEHVYRRVCKMKR